MSQFQFTITVPPGWQHTTPPDGNVALALAAGKPATSGFRPSVTVMAGMPTELSLPGRQREVAEELLAITERPDLEDLEIHDLAGHDVGYLRLAHQADGRELITEAWCWVVDGIGWLVLATLDCSDYADYCDLIEEIAWSFEPTQVPWAS